MARQIRIEYPGAIYHITWQRTAGDIRHKSRSISLTRHKIKITTISDRDVMRQRKKDVSTFIPMGDRVTTFAYDDPISKGNMEWGHVFLCSIYRLRIKRLYG